MTQDDQLIPLKKAAEIFLGDGKHVATLRAEALRGNLVVSKIGRGYWTTLSRLQEMDAKCRVEAQALASGQTKSETPGQSSTVDPVIAQGAALRKLDALKKSFRSTSKESTSRSLARRH